MFTGRQLADFCEQVFRAKWVYWYGTYGNKCTLSKYESKKAQYPSHYTAGRKAGYMKDIAEGRTCADCVGMIKAFFWTGGQIGATPKCGTYGCPDKSANGMIAICSQTGPIGTIPDEPGLVVWKDGHIGVYVGKAASLGGEAGPEGTALDASGGRGKGTDGYTVEMKGFNYDCQRNKVTSGPWTKWGRLPASMISYDAAPQPMPEPAPEGLRRGDYGGAVQAMQKALLSWNPDCLPGYGADGDFGSETEKAVKAFQTAAGLPVTGVYDEATRAALRAWPIESGSDSPTEQAQPVCVEVTGGSVNVRSAPGTANSRVLGVAHRGDTLPWQGLTAEVDGRDWYLVEYAGRNAWISSKYAKLTGGDGNGAADADSGVGAGGGDAHEPVKRGEKIVDLSKYQPDIDYDALIADTALIILRAGCRKSDGKIYMDECFKRHADELTERGVRFGVFFYSWADSERKARDEAWEFVRYARAYDPLFWAVDVEKPEITREAILAFAEELRGLVGDVEKIGAYVANHLYADYGFDAVRDRFDFVWIPKYSATRPKYPCDLWQYTSDGSVGGIDGRVDLNRITGEGHGLTWFTEG